MAEERVWDKFLTERDKQVFGASGYGANAGFGKRPALLVIDVSYAFCGDTRGEPILESIKRWRNSCGEDSWPAIDQIKRLIDKAREKGIPVIYTTGIQRDDMWDRGAWQYKNVRATEAPKSNRDGNDIVDDIAPGPADIVIKKLKPSCFFGTPLEGFLNQLQCDTLILTGTTTSGCVRATAADSFSYNYRTVLAEEACFDRSQASHAMTLCDLHAKYADVVKTDEVLAYMDSLAPGLFNLPKGKKPS